MAPTSFSQNILFSKCSLAWYFMYVKKIPVLTDMSYANAGNIVHKILEIYYSKKIIDINLLKEEFNKLWGKYKLNNIVNEKKESYWLMILNGIEVNKKFTSLELKIFYPDVVGFLDGVNTNEDEIVDWKTSTRSEENEEEYKKQMIFYSWLFYRKFDRLPKKCIVYYLKYNGTNGKLIIKPNLEDIKKIENWHNDIRENMDKIRNNVSTPLKSKICFFFCPYPNLCNSNENILKFILNIRGNYIFIDGPFTDLLHKGLTYNFSYELKNAHFIKKANPNINTTINFWKQNRRMLPLAMKDKLIEVLQRYAEYKKKEIAIDINDERVFNNEKIEMPENFVNDKQLRDYQEEAVETFMRKKIGMLEVATGAGKTEIAIECIRRLNMKTLFIVDKIELLNQTKKRIKDSLGIDVGEIGGGHSFTHLVTVATVQTLTKHLSNFASYLRSVRFVIFDEVHHVSARSYEKIAGQLISTEYRLGISGTAFRDDGEDMRMNSVSGYIIYNLNSNKLITEGWLIKPKIVFIKNFLTKEEEKKIENKCKIGLINETPNYSNYYNGFISENEKRNNVIKNIVEENKDKKILILTKLINHGQNLKKLIPNSEHLYGETNKEERKKILDNFVNGNNNVLISTISIFSEGIDIPQLNIIINVSANKGDVKTIQVLGRILRKLEGKKDAIYYDFWDSSKFFRMASYARRKILKKEGHEVEWLNYSQNLNNSVV